MPAGRPTDYLEEFAERVETFCADGYSLTAFAGEIGVCRATINNWCGEFPEFLEAVNRAKAARARWWEERAREIAQKGGPRWSSDDGHIRAEEPRSGRFQGSHAPRAYRQGWRPHRDANPDAGAEGGTGVRLIDETFGLVSHGGADADR